jgi:cysteine-rich repeat protein
VRSSAARLVLALPWLLSSCGGSTADDAPERSGEPDPSEQGTTAPQSAPSSGFSAVPTVLPSAVGTGQATMAGTTGLATPPAQPQPAPAPAPPMPCADLEIAERALPPGDEPDVLIDEPEPDPVCGNGRLEDGEVCDDGNARVGCSPETWDGCGACTVDPGFSCFDPGPCEVIEYCGDYRVTGHETCDDGNSSSGDGCSSTCTVEQAFACSSPGQPCAAVTCGAGTSCDAGSCPGPASCGVGFCGDGFVQPGELCDLGEGNNDGAYDRCNPDCTLPVSCADGILHRAEGPLHSAPYDEYCDDGNRLSNDGCSPLCTAEAYVRAR